MGNCPNRANGIDCDTDCYHDCGLAGLDICCGCGVVAKMKVKLKLKARHPRISPK